MAIAPHVEASELDRLGLNEESGVRIHQRIVRC
jgi:hypothetical protein